MRYLIALIGLAFTVPHQANAQAYEWRPVNQQTASMLRAGQYDAALKRIEAALADCPNAVTPVEAGLCTAIFSANLADVREHQGDLAAAEAGFRETLHARTEVLPPTDPLVGQADVFLALFFERHGRREEEITSLQAAETVARADGPAGRTGLVPLLTRHAMALAALGRPGDALPLYQDAYATARDSFGPAARDTLATLGNLFTGQINAGFPDAAIAAVSAALAGSDASQFDPTQRALLAGKLALETTTETQSKAAFAFVMAALPDLDNGLVVDPDASFTLLRGAARLNTALGVASVTTSARSPRIIPGDVDFAVELAQRARSVAAAKWGPASYAVSTALRTEADAEAARHDLTAAIARLTEAVSMLNGPSLGLVRVQTQVELSRMQWQAGHCDDAVAGDQTLLGSAVVTDATPMAKPAMLAILGEELVRLDAVQPGATACAQASDLAAPQPRLAKAYTIKALLCTGNAALAQGHAADALDAATRAQTVLWVGVSAPAEPNRGMQLVVTDLRARAFRDSRRNQEALAAYRDELALATRNGDVASEGAAYAQIGFVQRMLGLYREADESSVRGLALLSPNGALRPRANLLNNRALVAVALGRPADAVNVFAAALALRRAETVPETLAIASDERDLGAALSAIGRNAEAGRHMDTAIDLFRALGPARRAFLAVALDRRSMIAMAEGDPQRAEAALRELLPLQDQTGANAVNTRIVLAGLLDNQAHHDAAAALRAEALSIASAGDRANSASGHGANGAISIRVRLAEQAALRATGRLAEAAAAARQCTAQAASLPDMRLACLMAQAETDLAAGDDRDAAAAGMAAVVEAETHWTQDGGRLLQALVLQARTEAACGDADAVIRLYDRIHGLTPNRPLDRGWTDLGEGRRLMQAGETTIGLQMVQLSLNQANRLHDTDLTVAATGALAEHLVDTGKAASATALWQDVLPLLSEDAPVHRVTLLEGMGTAATAMGRSGDAALFFGEAVSLSRTEMGVGSASYARLVVAWAEALMQSGDPGRAEDAIRLLDADPAPAVQRLRSIGLLHLASMAGDRVGAAMLARSILDQARANFGPDSVGAASSRLDLIEVLMGARKHVDPAEMEAALAVIQAQDAGWRTDYRAARLHGLLAAQTGRLGDAMTSFMRAELLAATHEGPESLTVAMERANRASVELLQGHAAEADTLYRQALTMAAPDGGRRNLVWARIAGDAAVAAERVGDIERAIRLRGQAQDLLPPIRPRQIVRWL